MELRKNYTMLQVHMASSKCCWDGKKSVGKITGLCFFILYYASKTVLSLLCQSVGFITNLSGRATFKASWGSRKSNLLIFELFIYSFTSNTTMQTWKLKHRHFLALFSEPRLLLSKCWQPIPWVPKCHFCQCGKDRLVSTIHHPQRVGCAADTSCSNLVSLKLAHRMLPTPCKETRFDCGSKHRTRQKND